MSNDTHSNKTPGWSAIAFVLGVVGVIFAASGWAVYSGVQAHDIALMGFIAFGTIIVLFAAAVLYQIGNNMIPLSGIIAEPDDKASHTMGTTKHPKASLSRFQFLIFTFVVAGLFLMLSIEAGQMVDIPTNVLVLIGLSGTGFLAGKAVTNSAAPNPDDAAPNGQKADDNA